MLRAGDAKCGGCDGGGACLQQEVLRGSLSPSDDNTFSLTRVTDFTLAALQDSGWYDVKYGSAGISAPPAWALMAGDARSPVFP